MSYQWDVDLAELFDERRPQMVNRGLPEADVDGIRERTKDLWAEGPGGWVYEWSAQAEHYLSQDNNELALLAYGYAKFPTLADDQRRSVYRKQVDLCIQMGEADPVTFERRTVDVPYADTTVPVTVHQYSPLDGSPSDAPVLLASGGVDMWKDDLHGVWGAFVMFTGLSVLAFDIPGTGESAVPMSGDTVEIVSALVGEARSLGNGRVAHLGISMGGYFSARTGLTGEVDASVVFGGPVEEAFKDTLTVGAMGGILGNTLGFDAPPSTDELAAKWLPMSLSAELENQKTPTPMLVVNGANDPLIPQRDSTLFEGRPGAEVHLIPDSGHCAAEKLSEVVPMIIGWVAQTMTPAE